jgi:hypothetical protein
MGVMSQAHVSQSRNKPFFMHGSNQENKYHNGNSVIQITLFGTVPNLNESLPANNVPEVSRVAVSSQTRWELLHQQQPRVEKMQKTQTKPRTSPSR